MRNTSEVGHLLMFSAYIFTKIYVSVAAPKVSPPIVRNKLSIIDLRLSRLILPRRLSHLTSLIRCGLNIRSQVQHRLLPGLYPKIAK